MTVWGVVHVAPASETLAGWGRMLREMARSVVICA